MISFKSLFWTVSELDEAIALDDAGFQTKFGFSKPTSDTQIITHCMKGGRAQKAADALLGKGFKNLRYV